MKNNVWQKVCDFFNAQYYLGPNYSRVWRGRFIRDRRFKNVPLTLIETYRRYLTRAGYLNQVGRGIYEVVKPTYPKLTSKACYREAYPK